MNKKQAFVRFSLLLAACLFSASSEAADLFATGWGATFNVSPEGQLLFKLLQCVGIVSRLKSLLLLYRWHHGQQGRYGNAKCLSMFLGGCLLYYAHETANLIYNSI